MASLFRTAALSAARTTGAKRLVILLYDYGYEIIGKKRYNFFRLFPRKCSWMCQQRNRPVVERLRRKNRDVETAT